MLTHTKLQDSSTLWLLIRESNLLLKWKLLVLFAVDISSVFTVKADNTPLDVIMILFPNEPDEGNNRSSIDSHRSMNSYTALADMKMEAG